MIPRTARPPTTPPTMAPTGVVLGLLLGLLLVDTELLVFGVLAVIVVLGEVVGVPLPVSEELSSMVRTIEVEMRRRPSSSPLYVVKTDSLVGFVPQKKSEMPPKNSAVTQYGTEEVSLAVR